MNGECESVHRIVNESERHLFPFEKLRIPLNGIYILFQKGENGHPQERIVRIGVHKAEDRLPSRLKEHFPNENKDRSIFRKNIGRALLYQRNDPFLKDWERDLITRKEKYASLIDHDYKKEIEGLVSRYIQDNFRFSTFKVESKAERLEIESKLISTISQCDKCAPSNSWLGHSSPKEKIRDSGLRQEQELNKTPFDAGGIECLSKLIGTN